MGKYTFITVEALDPLPDVEATQKRPDHVRDHACPLHFQYQVVRP
jgi:hypothetical protein